MDGKSLILLLQRKLMLNTAAWKIDTNKKGSSSAIKNGRINNTSVLQ